MIKQTFYLIYSFVFFLCLPLNIYSMEIYYDYEDQIYHKITEYENEDIFLNDHNLLFELPDSIDSTYLLMEGVLCNDFFLHEKAVTFLTDAIQKDPYNIEAYKERLHAYFELGNIFLAIEDFQKIKSLESQHK